MLDYVGKISFSLCKYNLYLLMILDEKFWSKRYQDGMTGWDAGQITTPLKAYIDQLKDKTVKVLIPGCGYGHEVKYLYDSGFRNIFVVDISLEPLERLKTLCPELGEEHFIHDDFFSIEGKYDLIIEQTFFSAIEPVLRPQYVLKMKSLLSKKGKLVGLLLGVPMNSDHPPFGGSRAEYLELFSTQFELIVFEESFNSIPPRALSLIHISEPTRHTSQSRMPSWA